MDISTLLIRLQRQLCQIDISKEALINYKEIKSHIMAINGIVRRKLAERFRETHSAIIQMPASYQPVTVHRNNTSYFTS